MSNNYLLGVTGCSQGVRTKSDMKLQTKWNRVENYESPGVSGCAVGARTNFDKCLQTRFGPGGNSKTNCFGSNGTQPSGSKRNRKNRENFRTLAFDDTDNDYSYRIEYSPIK